MHQLFAVGVELGQRACLARLHKAALADHIGDQYGSATALHQRSSQAKEYRLGSTDATR